MRDKKRIKMILDSVMTVLMLLLMKVAFVGLLFHELLGIGVFLLFFLHNILNWTCTKSIIKKLFSPTLQGKVRFGMILNFLLFFSVTMIVGTGVLMSESLFNFRLSLTQTSIVSAVHHTLSYLTLLLLAVHIGLHWTAIMAGFRKMFHLQTLNRARTFILRGITLAIVVLGIRGSFTQEVYGRLTEIKQVDQNLQREENDGSGYQSSEKEDQDIEKDKKTVTAQDTTPPINLEEYLSKLYCNHCPKHCPLSAPQCSNGAQEAAIAQAEYYASQKGATSANKNSSSTTTGELTATTPSLEDFLSKLHCTMCPRNCPLSDPQCAKGEQQAAQASSDYYSQYGLEDNTGNFILGEALVDFLPIMGMYIAGTHYLLLLPKHLIKGGNREENSEE